MTLLAAGACGGDRQAPESGRYQESPMLRERVEAGELPPVEERLPDEPLVVEGPGSGRIRRQPGRRPRNPE